MSYQIKLPVFEGPFDLLLFFIERDELDIYDIPIAKITNDFLGYIEQLEQLNMEVAGDFILMAATLMRIKSRMLIPRPQTDEHGQEIDPRQQLSQRLFDYKISKELATKLSDYEDDMLQRDKRGNLSQEVKEIAENIGLETFLEDVDLYQLMQYYQAAILRHETEKNQKIQSIKPYPYTVTQQKKYLLQRLKTEGKLEFRKLFAPNTDKVWIVFNFLAILDLLQNEKLKVVIEEGYNNFVLYEN
ncbi:MAG: segregation and condensation protein A [Bernardetiaceae bacterium]